MKKTILLISTLTFSMFVVKAQNANLTNNLLDLGYGISGRHANAGKIGYQTFTTDALDVVGAGTTDGNRKIKFWNEGGAAFRGKVGIGTDTPTEMLHVNGNGLFSGRGIFGNYRPDTQGQIAGINLEVGGTSPTGTNPHATIYFHHHYESANQLRYNAGNFYFERCTNGWHSTDPKVSIGNVTNLGSYSLGVGGKIAARSATFMENIGVGTDTPTEKLQVNGNGLFSGRGLFGNYRPDTPGQIAGNSLEVGGPSPTGTHPHATIYFHHHNANANQLRYNNGNFYFERCTNGWGSTNDPTVSIGNVTNLGSYSLGVGGKIAARSATFTEALQVNGNGLFSGRGIFGDYRLDTSGQIAGINLEVGGPSPTGTNPHATIYFHHHYVSANQLRYNNGIFYFERCTNAWGAMDPKVVIGNVTNPGSYRLAVGGKIAANGEVRVFTTNTSSFPDYVFDASYQLPTLEDTEKYIQQNKHLPEVPTAAEIEKEGMSLNGMNEILLKKVEELTLHVIHLSKENEALKKRMEQIEKK